MSEAGYSTWLESLTARAGGAVLDTKKTVEKQSGYRAPDPEVGRRQVSFTPADQAAIMKEADPEASPSWGARFLAGLKASPHGRMEFLRKTYGGDRVHEVKDSSGGIVNVVIERPGQKPMLLDPAGINMGDLADLSGNILETAGGVAGAVLAARAGRGKAGSAGIEAAGDLAGSAIRQGVSALIPGDDDLSPAERAAMMGINVVGGQIGNAVQGAASFAGKEAPIPKLLGGKGVLPSTRAQAELGRQFADEAGQESLHSVTGETIEQNIERAAGIEGRVNATLKEGGESADFRFTGPQATGSKTAAKAWNVIAQTPEAGDEIIREERRQLSRYGKAVEMYTNKIASDPKMLGNDAVGDQVVKVLDQHIGDLRKARSEAARPLFEAAHEASRGAKIVPTDRTVAAIQQLLKEGEFLPASQIKPLREALEAIQIGSTGKGRIGIDQVQNLMKTWGDIAAGEGTIIEGAKTANQRRMAGAVVKAIEADLDAASHGPVNAAAIDALTAARQVWREHSKGIDDVSTGVVNKLLKLEGEPTAENVVNKLLGMGKAEVRSVMRLVEKTDPSTAANIRAQSLVNLLEKAGHGVETPGGAQMTSVQLSPQQLASLGKKHGKQLNAIFAGDTKSQAMLRDIFEAADLMASGPALRGAQTQPNQWTMGVMQKAMAGAPRQVFAELQGAALNAVQRGVFSPQTVMRLIALPEGAEAFHKLVRMNVAAPAAGAEGAKRTSKEAIRLLTHLTVLAGRDALFDSEKQDNRASPYEYAGGTKQ